MLATIRTPREDSLPPSDRLRVLQLDVMDPHSIHKAIEAAGPIDVLVNNAGFGAPAPFELTDMATVRALFDTKSTGAGTRMQNVAEAVWRAATDASTPPYIPAGADAVQWAAEAG
ncbi:SDR family NAD(P)-dependent oxidoreductase [Variovorax sp. ZT4R33]|uniref:SDR family NAD(P)-dependent oxidoreductase n=1 Tax=Variovorax sp. ZT4R33 TaxID=3443743 RepID=UPI003F450A18